MDLDTTMNAFVLIDANTNINTTIINDDTNTKYMNVVLHWY